jgi:hypothetical protein
LTQSSQEKVTIAAPRDRMHSRIHQPNIVCERGGAHEDTGAATSQSINLSPSRAMSLEIVAVRGLRLEVLRAAIL